MGFGNLEMRISDLAWSLIGDRERVALSGF